MGYILPIIVSADQACQSENIKVTTPKERFAVNKDHTVTDRKTGLMWQRCLIGQSGEQCESGSPSPFTWGDALLQVPEFNNKIQLSGFSDWRLPNIRELATLAELQCARPAINLKVFPNNPSAHLWSSSPYKFYPHYSWYLDFEYGVYTYGDRTDTNKHIRLVRNAGS